MNETQFHIIILIILACLIGLIYTTHIYLRQILFEMQTRIHWVRSFNKFMQRATLWECPTCSSNHYLPTEVYAPNCASCTTPMLAKTDPLRNI